jgi:hypothetical protein
VRVKPTARGGHQALARGAQMEPGAGTIGDDGRHRTRTWRRGGGGTTHSDRRRGSLDGAWRSDVGTQGPTAWGGLELWFMRAHGRRCEVGQHRKRRGRGGAAAASVEDGSKRRRRRGGAEEQRRRCRGGGARAAALRSDSERGSFGQRPLGPGRVDGGQCCRADF